MYLIVGASGFIGNKLYNYYKGNGVDVKGTYYYQTFEGSEKDGIYLNFSDLDLALIVSLKQLTHIFLCHGITGIDQCKVNRKLAYKVNVTNTIKLLKEYINTGVIPVYLSTGMVYDGTRKDSTESDVTNPITEYGEQKVEVEQYITANFDKYIILRLSKVFGIEKDDRTLFTTCLDSLLKHKKILSAVDVFISPIYVMDVINALKRLVSGGHYGTFNLGGLEIATWYEFSQRLAEYFKCDLSFIEKKAIKDFKFIEPRPLYSSLDSSKIVKTTGVKLASVNDCFKLIESNYGEGH